MNSISFDTPKYLQYLSSRFTEKGGRFLRATVQHIQQIVEGGINLFSGEGTPTPPDAVVVCTGLWSRFLGGVEDKDVYPIRGQTVLIRAPWIKFALARTDKDSLTYIIPRKSGDVSASTFMPEPNYR
jgi:D-amino-acid oxidase